MTSVTSQVSTAHRLLTSWELDLECSGRRGPMIMKLPHHLQQLSQHIGDAVPQPAHISQIKARSVERAMRASHGATGWACQAAGDAAHLARLWSARGGVHREIVGAVQDKFCNQDAKGLTSAALC